MDSDTTLTLANFGSGYELLVTPNEAWMLQRELDKVAREQLPRLLADYLLPQVDPNYAVYRIRDIDIDLTISRDAVRRGQLPQLWAKQILRVIFRELRYGSSANVVRYATHADLVADFVADRVSGRASRSWVYEELAPLSHLSVGDAVAELLSERPAYFVAVAKRLAQQGLGEALLTALDERQTRRILKALDQAASRTPGAHELLAFVRRNFGGQTGLSGHAVSFAHRRLAVLLPVAATAGDDEQMAAVLVLSRHVALVQHVLLQLATASHGALEQTRDHDKGARLSFSALVRVLQRPQQTMTLDKRGAFVLDPALRAELLHTASQYQHQEHGHEYLDVLLERVRQMTPGLSFSPSLDFNSDGIERRVQDALPVLEVKEVVEFGSACAGFSLLLPTIRDLKLNDYLSTALLRQCLTGVFAGPSRRLCELDPFWDALFPVETFSPSPAAWPEMDESCLQGLEPEQRAAVRGRAAADAWGSLILYRFARRLTGLEASSRDYLRRQFLQRPGRIRITPESVTVSMASIPLGIVLKMAGLGGWQGRVPWLQQRELVIEIPAG